MTRHHLNDDVPHTVPYTIDGELYDKLHWSPVPDNASIELSGIPPLDHTLYLFNTDKFHLGQSFRLFDEEAYALFPKIVVDYDFSAEAHAIIDEMISKGSRLGQIAKQN